MSFIFLFILMFFIFIVLSISGTFYLLYGKLGSGKTLYLVYLATILKRPIWSNFKLYLPNYHSLDPSDIPFLPMNINAFFDEISFWLDCRVSMSKKNRYLSYVQMQSRKLFMDIFGTLQLREMLDLRYQLSAEYEIKCEAFGSMRYKGVKVPEGFRYTTKDSEGITTGINILDFSEAEKLIGLYDTLELIDPIDKDELEYEFIVKNKKKLTAKVNTIIEVVNNQIIKITHESVKVALWSNEFPTQYAPYVYNVLKGNYIMEGLEY